MELARTGAIRDIGSYVLRRACADTAAWRDAYPGAALAVHVNVSALQLDEAGFIDGASACLREFGLPAEQLVLEITETIVISSPVAIERLNILAGLGVTIAIEMGMRTIAEGVERPEQQKFLEGIRTDAVQGFLYLRPCPAVEFGAWLGTHLAGPRALSAPRLRRVVG